MKGIRSSWGFEEDAADGTPVVLRSATRQVLEEVPGLLHSLAFEHHVCPPSTAQRDSVRHPSGVCGGGKAHPQWRCEPLAGGHTCSSSWSWHVSCRLSLGPRALPGWRHGVSEGLSPVRAELTLARVLPLQCLLAQSSCPRSLPLMQAGPLRTPLLFPRPQPPVFFLNSFLHRRPAPGSWPAFK